MAQEDQVTAVAHRSTTRRNRHRRAIAHGRPPCHLCGGDIDYDAESHLDPKSFTIDHIIPLNRGGADVLDNLAACHRQCNRAKSDGRTGRRTFRPVAYITRRAW